MSADLRFSARRFPLSLASALHGLSLYIAAAITSFGWALCQFTGWDATPWLPLWFCGALLIYNVDRLRRDPADALNLPERTAMIERLRPASVLCAAIAGVVLIVLPLWRGDPLALMLVVAGSVVCLNYSIPMFGLRLKSIPLLKTFFVPASILGAIVIPPWLREGAPALPAATCVTVAWSWCFLEFNVILFDLRDIEGDRRCSIASLPVLLGVKTTRSMLAALILITTLLALSNAARDPHNRHYWVVLGVLSPWLLSMILVETRVPRSERFYEWVVEGMIFLPALVLALTPAYG